MHHEPEWSDDMPLIHHETKLALGGDATIAIVCPDGFTPDQLFAKLWRDIYAFEKRFSRFLWGSELTTINARAGQRTGVSAEMHHLLQRGIELSQMSEGLLNPFVLPELQRLGYLHSTVERYRNDPVPDYRQRSVANIEQMHLESDAVTIPFHTAIDIAGHGKGYLADQIARALDLTPATGYWIALSGDVAIRGHDGQGRPWKVQIQQIDEKANYHIETDGATLGIATSGTCHRDGQGGTLKGHHLIDPRTMKPAETDLSLATVVADDACLADSLASCAVMLGSDIAPAFLHAKGARDWLLQADDFTVSGGGQYIITTEVPHAIQHMAYR